MRDIFPIIPEPKIFVFGSNEAGIHGAGAARDAVDHYGAKRGKGHGLHGRSYAIPTKDRNLQTLPLPDIEVYVKHFLMFAEAHDDLVFFVTKIGCGLAGYDAVDIAPMFKSRPANVELPEEFLTIIEMEDLK
ncbi:MAG: hypothetical protein KF855_03660 [Acidobacteria bacterium]|nr:hypothetical protein [Acidobacteriota bacterium]